MIPEPLNLTRLSDDLAVACSHWAMVLKLGVCTREELVEILKPTIRDRIERALVIQEIKDAK